MSGQIITKLVVKTKSRNTPTWDRNDQAWLHQEFQNLLTEPGIVKVADERHRFNPASVFEKFISTSQFQVFEDRRYPHQHWYMPKATFAYAFQNTLEEQGLPHFALYEAPLPVAFSSHFDDRALERSGLMQEGVLAPDAQKVFGLLPEIAASLELSEPQRFAVPYGLGMAVGWILPVDEERRQAFKGERIFGGIKSEGGGRYGSGANKEPIHGPRHFFLIQTYLPQSELSEAYKPLRDYFRKLFSDPAHEPTFKYASYKAHGSVWGDLESCAEQEQKLKALVKELVESPEWKVVAERPLTAADRENIHHVAITKQLPFDPSCPLPVDARVTNNLSRFLLGNAQAGEGFQPSPLPQHAALQPAATSPTVPGAPLVLSNRKARRAADMAALRQATAEDSSSPARPAGIPAVIHPKPEA